MQYKVTKQYARGGEASAATFNDIKDAKSFIQKKLAEDANLKVKVIYRLYERMVKVEEFNPDELPANAGSGSGGSQQGQGKQQSYRPTPLNTAPRPPGMLPNWWKDEDDDQNK